MDNSSSLGVALSSNPQLARPRAVPLLLAVEPHPHALASLPAFARELRRLADVARKVRVALLPAPLDERRELNDKVDEREPLERGGRGFVQEGGRRREEK